MLRPRREPLHGLVLAGGASSRMGRPKALLTLGGETFAARLTRLLRGAGCAEVVLVAGAHVAAISAGAPFGARVVATAAWRRGMRASLRAGLCALPPGDVLLTHVDRPLVAPATLALLAREPAPAPVVPVYAGLPGHPVRLPAAFRARLLAPDDTPLRDLLAGTATRLVAVCDPGVAANINTPEDYARLPPDLHVGHARVR